MKKNKRPQIIYGVLVFLCLISVWFKISSLGFVFLAAVFFLQAEFLQVWALKTKKISLGFLSYFFLISFYVIGLSLIYYLFGLSPISVSVFLLFSGFWPFFFNLQLDLSWPFKAADRKKFLANPWRLLALAALLFLLARCVLLPIMDGSPTPWDESAWVVLALFGLAALILSADIFSPAKRPSFFVPLTFLFFILAMVPLRYVLSFGYDTLIHQGALAEIAVRGRIFPLTPFYVGQYSLEILINFVSGASFVFIERWLVPLFFLAFCGSIGYYFLKKFGRKNIFFVVPAAVLLFLPTVFCSSSPYALALVFSLAAAAFIYVFLRERRAEFYWAALALALAATLIHPFVGLNVLLAAWLAKKFSLADDKKNGVWLWVLFLVVSLAVVAAFALYNWLGGKTVFLSDPTYYLDNFLNIFSSPSWYVFDRPAWWLSALYFFERWNFFLIFILAGFFVFRSQKDNSAAVFIFVLALGAFVSAWLFISGIQVEGYSAGDQVNYSYRLLSSAKWFLFFPALLSLAEIFSFLAKKNRLVKISAVIGLALLLSASLYLTYPRYDEISRLGVNNIRAIDYQIIDLIREREGGKDGYLVFANQLFGGAAIQKYGFGPYYKSHWGDLFYYSTPMASETNKRFNQIMDEDHFNPELLYKVMRETAISRAYLVTTDYWQPKSAAEAEIAAAAEKTIRIGENNFIYFFPLK